MAKKKEVSASPFVPVEEQPYKIPENWCWTKLGAFIDIYRGVSYKKDDAHTVKSADDCLILRGGNILEGAIDLDADNIYVDRNLVQETQLIKKHDVIIVSSTGSSKVIGRAGISYSNYTDVAFGAFLTLARPKQIAVKQFVDLFFQSELYRERIRQLASGVNINNIRMEYITDTPFPLPPLPEQQRIVTRIESLFAKLDEAKEKTQAVVDEFELRKSAILHRAFTGELTEKWRKENGVGLDSWKSTPLPEICQLKSGTAIPADRELPIGQIPYVKVADMNLAENQFEITTSSRFVDNINPAQLFPSKCVIFPKRGGAIFTGKRRIVQRFPILADLNIMAIIPNEAEIRLPYLYYWFLTIDLKTLNNGSNVPQINNKDLIPLIIPLASLEEQEKIILILDDLLGQEQQAKEAAEAVLAQIDTMKKAILARAFRGELGTNDPAEEWAGELLKTIL